MKLAFVYLRFRQVIPSQLETILKSHPGVEDAAVVGVKCDDYGELPLAYAMKKPGYDYLNDTSLISFLHGINLTYNACDQWFSKIVTS